MSQFARERKFRSPHNQKYWNHTPYLGLGPSAHSFDGNRRWWNKKKLTDWQQALNDNASPIDATEQLAPADIMLETLMTGFRTYDGVDAAAFTQRFGVDLIGLNASRIERLRGSGLIKRVDRRLIPTLDGLAVADSLATMFRFDAAS